MKERFPNNKYFDINKHFQINSGISKKKVIISFFGVLYLVLYGMGYIRSQVVQEEVDTLYDLINTGFSRNEVQTIGFSTSLETLFCLFPEPVAMDSTIFSEFNVSGWISIKENNKEFNFSITINNQKNDLTAFAFEGYVKNNTIYFRNMTHNNQGYVLQDIDFESFIKTAQQINVRKIGTRKEEVIYVIEEALINKSAEVSTETSAKTSTKNDPRELSVFYQQKLMRVDEIDHQHLIILDESNWWTVFTLVDF